MMHLLNITRTANFSIDNQKMESNFLVARSLHWLQEAPDCIKKANEDLGYVGYKKAFKATNKRYYEISQQEVQWLANRCCTYINPSNKSQRPLGPIVSHSIFKRAQIDLIDMRQ